MVVLTLALGIGANTAIFSVVKAVLLNQLPYRDPERLVKIAESDPDNPLPETIDFTTTDDLRARSHSFESVSLFRDGDVALVDQGKPELLEGLRVNYEYFDTLGLKMQLGRSFVADEDHPETRYVAILSHGLWVRRFGGDSSIIGRTVRLNDKPYKVVGVLPESFRPFGRLDRSALPEIYAPLGYDLKQPWACRGCQHLQLIGRLKPGVSVEQARAELNTLLREIVREHPKDYDARTVIAISAVTRLHGRKGANGALGTAGRSWNGVAHRLYECLPSRVGAGQRPRKRNGSAGGARSGPRATGATNAIRERVAGDHWWARWNCVGVVGHLRAR